ncbi:MAG: hypothetical protein IJL21_01360 [Alphaproteobacteria bacterium]|nr:hypothetical protein [Alphaproteobacteria bacterium]
MKKINLFSRNTNSPSYRRMPVSSGIVENRHTAEARCPGIAIAMTCPAGDFSSQGDEKHNVCDASFCIRKNWVPAFAGMTIIAIAALFATPSFATPTELDKKTVASKAYVDTKQDLIDSGNVLLDNFDDNDVYLPGLVAYDSTTQTLKGNKVGILDLETLNNTETMLENFGTRDDLVPTIAAVQAGFDEIWGAIPDGWTGLDWDSTLPSAINAYSTTFDSTSTHVNGNWPRYSQGYLVRAQTFANSLALKQNKIPAGTAGNVVTYSGTAGTVGSVATANAPTYNETTGVLENGTNIATIAAVDTRQKKMTCAGWDSETHTDEHCWLWSIEE